jgi:riboflavin kinase/FMN adenylyltransferase
VAHGTEKGKVLGIRTATLKTRSNLIPPDGVYAVQAEVLGDTYLALANIGCQPTFGFHRRAVEIHILDFDRDIYGESMTILFLERIRAEKRFEVVSELREQIEKDIRRVSAKY